MASKELIEVMKRAQMLSTEEQLQLISYLADRARQASSTNGPRYMWRDIQGVAPYPLVGEDAQAWVSRTRQESDEGRDWHGSGTP